MYSLKETVLEFLDLAKIPVILLTCLVVIVGGIWAMWRYADANDYKRDQQFISQCAKMGGAASIDSYSGKRTCTRGLTILISQQ